MILPWMYAADPLFLDMTISFKDGTSISGFTSARDTYQNGVLQSECGSGKPIVLEDIESVTIGGQTFPVE